MKLSVIIITKNEARDIEACLNSVAFADERIIVDSGSTDDTVEIAERMGARVISRTDWSGFGSQKNRALDAANGDWVFSLDADERVSDSLREEILQAITTSDAQAYWIPRSSAFCGIFLKYSGTWRDRIIRLWKRGSARFSDDIVHEKVVPTGTTGQLKNPIVHYSYRNFEELLEKTNRYSTDGAIQAYRRGKRSGFGSALSHGFWSFFKTYVLQLGFLDGATGVMYAISRAEVSYYKYVKLRFLERTQNRQ